MKKTLTALSLLVTLTGLAAKPELVGFTSLQNPHEAIVRTSFTLAGDAILTVDVKTNGVSIGWRNFRPAMTGATLNRVNPAGAYTLLWNPETSWDQPVQSFPAGVVSVEVTAWSPDNPPDYMDIDLTASSNVTYYVSEEDLPYAVTDDLYKTTHLLMKRMHAANKVWLMGSPSTESGRSKGTVYETQHPVCLSHDYYIGVYELTQGQYEQFGLTVPDGQSAVGPKYPVAKITHSDLRGWWNYWWPRQGYTVDKSKALYKMRTKTGVTFDLPTEEQWEYACRGGSTTAYISGESTQASLKTYAVYSGNAPTNAAGTRTCAEVGTLAPNGFGLYDMIGNVSEFCREQQASNLGAAYACDSQARVISTDAGNCHLSNRGSNYDQGWSNWNDTFKETVQWHRVAFRGQYYSTGPSNADAKRGVRLVAPVSRDWPTVSVAMGTVAQDSSRRVAITYALEEEAIVTLELYKDGERVSDEALRAVCGDVNRVVATNGTKCIYWQPDASWEGETVESGHLAFKIRTWATNDPPAYMALDLRSSNVTNISYYASAEAMPEPITNDLWKTDYLVMRRIPAKDVTWWMGIATNSTGKSVEDVGYDPTRSPRHRVKLSQDYYMSVFELTCRQARVFETTSSAASNKDNWTKAFAGKWNSLRWNGGSGYAWPTHGHAVSTQSNIYKFRTRFGLQFDLPTEAQWEYACRAGTDGRYHGFSSLRDCAWFGDSASGVHPVGLKKPNAWGLYDMLGNVQEYCLEGLTAGYGLTNEQLASETPVVDPYGSATSTNNKIMRGGAYSASDYECRSGDRHVDNHVDAAWASSGFRLVCALPYETFAEPVLPAAE